MERDSKTIYQEIITVRLDADIEPQMRTDETVRLLGEIQTALRVELQKALETKDFILTCSDCDTDGPETYEKALAEGWEGIRSDDSPWWNFIGTCTSCK